MYFLTDLTEVFERFLFINSKCFSFLGLLLISYCFEEYCSHYFNFLNISYFIHRRIPFILEFFLDSFSTLDFFKLFCHPTTNLQPIFNVPFVVKSPCTQFPRLFPMLFSYSNFHPQHHHIYLLRTKWVYQGCRIKDQFTNIDYISIYWQWIIRNWKFKNIIYNSIKNMKYLGQIWWKMYKFCTLKTVKIARKN